MKFSFRKKRAGTDEDVPSVVSSSSDAAMDAFVKYAFVDLDADYGEEELLLIARFNRDEAVRLEAVKRIDDRQKLLDLAKISSDAVVVEYIVGKLENMEELAAILEVVEERSDRLAKTVRVDSHFRDVSIEQSEYNRWLDLYHLIRKKIS